MKYLLVLAVLLIAFQVWRNGREKADRHRRGAAPAPKAAPTRTAAPTQAGTPAAPVDMVRCAVCGVHLPETEAVRGRDAVYCGAAHRLAAET